MTQDLDLIKKHFYATNFLRESLNIEGIKREPTQEEVKEHLRFMELEYVNIGELIKFVYVFEPHAKLRDQVGMDVRVGNYSPPKGGNQIENSLYHLTREINERIILPYEVHKRFETLHPFTDCNGRSGRMLWLWMMREAPLGFLHTWYYQSLEAGRWNKN